MLHGNIAARNLHIFTIKLEQQGEREGTNEGDGSILSAAKEEGAVRDQYSRQAS